MTIVALSDEHGGSFQVHTWFISKILLSEYVFLKKIDLIELNGLQIKDFTVDIGVMDYGIEIDGIIGTDFLMKVRGVVDLDKLLFESRLKEG
ncbi:hypothetical protein [Desulfuribacillus alkaliarsenatis]|uniref:Uncharacterized protein n=1 Tax=Desulfuribacillus alkaliarsenatis TaxID=766136 RepID=A0A1E5G297_9FIRM|nr:hypothetical protein [Desulfuribacillus alkaliarsenatis]OEF96661.1 hypothetical protein BHF68_06165 [Desulfuribacillus alkaliarsenatis]